MRILHVDTGRQMRGGQYQVLSLLEGLRESGHECLLLARPHTPLWEAAHEGAFRVRPATVRCIFEASTQSDLVHVHDAHAHALAAIAARSPVVVSRRVAFPIARSMLSAWKYRRAARFIAVSQFVAERLRTAGVPSEKIDVVYDGVELSHDPIGRNASGPVVALASKDPQKGRDLVERAGEISGKRVIFSENLARDLPGAALFVYITRSEGLGSAALLAMNLGVPVIASRLGGLMEVIIDGSSGLLVENEPEEVARAIRRLSEDSILACSLAERARSRVAQCFSREKLISGTLAVYGRVLAA